MWISVGRLAKRESVNRTTIQVWIKEGKYPQVKRTEGGHYRIWVEEPEVVILYGRVSSSKQISSIETQKKLLLKEFPNGKFISDVASGFNFERPRFKTVLERALDGTPICLVATTQDRISRVAFGLIKRIIELSGGQIILLEESDSSEQFDTKSLIGFITSFVNSHYGKRSAERRKSKSDNLEED